MKTILKKHIVVLIVYIGFCIVALAGVVMLFTTMKSKIARVSEIKERLASYQKNKKAFEEEARELRALQERIGVLEQYIVTSDSLPALLSTLESVALKNTVGFEITSVQTPIENEKTKLLIDATTKGSYAQVRAFFTELERQPFQVKIRKLYLFSEQGEEAVAAISGTLSGPKTTKSTAPKIPLWQGVATIEILSF